MRKLFAFLGLLVIASMVITACGPGGTAEPAGPGETQPPEQPGAFKSKDPTTYFQVSFGELETLDPHLDYESAGLEVLSNIYETLVWYNREKASDFIPWLATEWTLSDDGLVYTFTIRQGVKFHEGGDMTPSDVAYSFQRGLLQGNVDSPIWLLAEPFFGTGIYDVSDLVDPSGALENDRAALSASDPVTLKSVCEQVTNAIVADDAAGTVTMTLKQPWGPFLASISAPWGAVMDTDWTVENGGWDGSCDTWQNFYGVTADEDPFTSIANGTGPFKLDHWTKGQEIVLVRNDDYWRTEPAWEGGPTGPAALERVVISKVDEFGTRFAAAQAGDADTLQEGSNADYVQMDTLAGEECLYDESTGNFLPCTPVGDGSGPLRVYKNMPEVAHADAFFNFAIGSTKYIGSGALDGNGVPPDFFADEHIRKAFNYCFDWEAEIADVMAGDAVQTITLPVAGMPGYDPDADRYTYDVDKCTEEFKLADLDKDGIPAGDDPEGDVWTTGFRLQATYNQGNTARQSRAGILAAGVNSVNEKFLIEITGLPWAAFLQAQRAKELPLFFVGWLEDIHDPHNWYQPYTVGTYGNRQSLPEDVKSQFSDILDRGVSESDPAKRAEIYAEANQLFYDTAPGILLTTPLVRRYEQRWVHGFFYNPLNNNTPNLYYYVMSKD